MDVEQLKSKLQLLEIPLADLGSVTQLPGHVRAKWASHGAEGERSGSLKSIEAKLDRAERKREEFRSWVTEKARTRTRVSQTSEERRAKHLQRLQDRLVLAEANRLNTLEAVKLKAAAEQVKLEAVVSKLNELLERKAQKIDEGLKAAERRRQALMEAEKERLNAAHELVLARLVSAQERDKQDVSAKQRAIENRLQQAGEIRHQHLAERAARASEKVARAKQVSTLARRLAQQDAQQKITSWRAKLEGAAERRQSRQARQEPESSKRGTAAARSTTRQAKSALSEAERERLSVIHHSMRARHVQNMWRSFVNRRKTTAALVHSFVATNITGLRLPDSPQRSALASESDGGSSACMSDTEGRDRPVLIGGISVGQSPVHAPFEEFAAKLQAPGTLKMAQALLRRLEHRLQARGTADRSCTALLRRLFPRAPRNSNIERYPTRVFLCAYMILRHPEIVFNATGERERSLSTAAKDLIFAFELLLQRILEPPPTPLVFSPGKSPNASNPASSNSSPKGSANSSPGSSLHGSPKGGAKGGSKVRGTGASTPKSSAKGSARASSRGSPSLPISACSSPSGRATPSEKSGSGRESPASSAPGSRMDSPRSLSSPTPGGALNPPVVPPSPLKEGMQAYRAAMKLKLSGAGGALKGLGTVDGQKGGNEFITIGQLLVQFDEAWLAYLDQFVAWKSHDAVSLVQELIRMAVRLETSMRRKVGVGSGQTDEFERRVAGSKDLQAMVAQVKYDHQLLKERIAKLSGQQGLTRLDEALEAARNQSFGGTTTASDSQAGSDTESVTSSSSRRNSHGTESEWETDGATTPSSVYRRPNSSGGVGGKEHMSPETLKHLADTRQSLVAATGHPAAVAERPPRPSTAPAAAQRLSPGRVMASPPATPTPAPTPVPAPASSVSRGPVGTGIREWSAMHAAGLSNEQMVWELVYNPEFQLPMGDAEAAWKAAVAAAASCAPSRGDPAGTEPPPSPTNLTSSSPEEALASLRARARQQAERAFWDSVQSSLQQGLMHGGAAAVAARLVTDLAGTLVELVADPNRSAAIQQQFAESELTQQLQATKGVSMLVMGGMDVARLLEVLDSLGKLLSVMGAPSHEAEVKAAHARMAEQLALVVGGGISGEEGAEKLAKAVCRVLRLMWSQLSLMKIQAANARLRGVAIALQGVGAVRYLSDKFRRAHSLPVAAPVAPEPSGEEPVEGYLTPPLLSTKLPRTCTWFNGTVDAVLPVLQRLQAASLQLPSEVVLGTWLSTSTAAPVRMASGRGQVARSPSGVWPENTGPATNPVLPVQPMSWRGRVRCGLVSLISSSTPAASDSTPEVLQWDARRLHEAQNRFQQLLVCTASLLIAQQMRGAKGLPPWTATHQQDAKQRLLLTLEDPAMKLPDLIGLLSQFAGATTMSEEAQIRMAFTRIIDPSASAFQVMGVSLSVCLSLLVMCGPSLLDLSTGSSSVSSSPAASPLPYAAASTAKEGLGSLSPSAGLFKLSPAARSSAPSEVADFAAGLRGLLAKGGSVILAPELASLAASILTMASVVEAVHEDIFSTLDAEI